VPGVRTAMLDPVVVHPTALLIEAGVLGGSGIHDAFSRLTIDARCRVTTPYHQAAGRLRERLRGARAHGTCGVGVGETVRHAIRHPDLAIRYSDLPRINDAWERVQIDKLKAIQATLLAEFLPLCPPGSDGALTEEFQTLQDDSFTGKWLSHCHALARQCPPGSTDSIHAQLTQPGCVLFEGAQGVLLDEWRGFHPHTTWSSISTTAVEQVATRFGITSPIEHFGVMRTYLTRHGVGPLPTHDESLDDHLYEPHNQGDGWQGSFRRGHPDAVLLRYALESIGGLSGILVSHLDVFQCGRRLKWCESYDELERLPLSIGEDLSHQEMLTNLLLRAQPRYSTEEIESADSLLERLRTVTQLPVVLSSHGPTSADVR